MIKALLFDLDDTLLGNDMRVFLPAYFQAVAGHFPDLDGASLVRHLMAGTRAMLANTDPARPLRQVFLDNFPPAQDGRAAQMWARFEAFYSTEFARLRVHTQPRPAARLALEWAFAAGYRVVVATSPLFPLAAILERLNWAGADGLPFDLITHIEKCRFAKPHPEYLAEILARLGLRPEEALLIGNDWSDDMVPAARLGMPHYWVTETDQAPPSDQAQPLNCGPLEAFLPWAQQALGGLEPPHPPPTSIPPLLLGHLACLLDELTDLPAALWTRRPAAAEWSLTEVVCHLRDVDQDVNQARVSAVLEGENPFLTGADTDPWVGERD